MIVIVGAGAAGLMTAIAAAESGGDVLLLEGAKRPGAKILVSGGTRCNVTNDVVTERDFRGGSPNVIRRVLKAFPAAEARRFFEEGGVPLKLEPNGKLFPVSDSAKDVLASLLRRAERSGVRLRSGARVEGVDRTEGGFRLAVAGESVEAPRLVLATGGLSLPRTGSDGAGLRFAKALGHTLVPTTPALAPLLLDGREPHASLSGVSLEAELTVAIAEGGTHRIRGSLLFTHFGLSGPAALDASRFLARARLEHRAATATLSSLPGETFESANTRLLSAAAASPTRSILRELSQLLPERWAETLLAECAIDPTLRLGALTKESRRALVHRSIARPLAVTGDRGYAYAEATAGGVGLDEVDPGTMESRRAPGLFLAGEMLDVDGRLGGFNFQWAWSSGRVAGRGAARG